MNAASIGNRRSNYLIINGKGNDMNTATRKPLIDEKKVAEWHSACEASIADMKTLCDNGIVSVLGETITISKEAFNAIRGARSLVEIEVLSLMDSTSAAFGETCGSFEKLKAANERVKNESAFLSAALSGIQRKTVEISEYAAQLERLNKAMEQLKANIDGGLFSVAAKCAAAIDG